MRVEELMSRNPHTCTADQKASDAARAMWDFDIGCIPIIDDKRVPIAMVTDRDICMAAYMKNAAPTQLRLRDAMSRSVLTCKATDSLASAESVMRKGQVRRLPVVDAEGKLIGVLSLNDLVMAGAQSGLTKAKQRLMGDLNQTLSDVCRHRPSEVGAQL
jgi:CBS domain-containing protein